MTPIKATAYGHPEGCFPLFDSPIPGVGNFVVNLVTANHDPFGDPLCPLPTFDPLFPCIKRQIFDCVGTDLERCLPRIFTNTDGNAEALLCECFDDTGECGPVSISPDGDILSCSGACPNVAQDCDIHIDGSSTGAPSIPVTAVPDGAEVTCDCTCDKEAPGGIDGWATACDGSTSYDFSLTPIPADFFDPGSDPFTDVVALGGLTGGIDTEVLRKDGMCFDGPLPVTAVTGVRIIRLDLVSCDKILVTSNGGQTPEEWQVIVRLAGPQAQGTLTAIKLDDDGGTYTATIPVNAEFLFVRNSDGMQRGPIPAGTIPLTTTVPAPWDQTNCAVGFCPGFTTDPDGPCCKPTCHRGPSPGHEHCTQPQDCRPCEECVYDNGPPLDDFGGPASQYDSLPPEVFSAEAADDFFFTGKGTNPCDIQAARFWATHFNTPAGVVPNPVGHWTGVTVSIYENADPKGPAGNRNDDGTFTPGLVATRTVPMSSVGVIPMPFACLGGIFQIDVNFLDPISLEKNHKYWIVFQPNMDRTDDPAGGPGYGQVAVLLSEENHDHPAQQIFPLAGLPNWIEISGNAGTDAGCNNLPPGSLKDIAFELFAVKRGPEPDPPIRAPAPDNILKNRYISIDPRGAAGANPAAHHIRVAVDSTLVPGLVGSGPWWANAPVNGQPPSPATCISIVTAAKPAVEPDWSGCPTLHLTGCPIVPTTTYAIAAEAGGVLSADALFDTQTKPGAKWLGDAVGNFTGPAGIPPNVWTAPQGTVNIDDVFAAIVTFIDPNAINATHLSVTDMHPVLNGDQMTLLVNINDALIVIKGFQGDTYGEIASPFPDDEIPDLTECP